MSSIQTMNTTPTGDAPSEREAFEAWVKRDPLIYGIQGRDVLASALERDADDDYANHYVHNAWVGWHAALAPQASREPSAFEAIASNDLDAIEKRLGEYGGAAFGFVPKDARDLANMALHMVREVRAARAAPEATAELDALAAHPRWQLDCEVLKFGKPGKWRVWTLRGKYDIKILGDGDTPVAALRAALAATEPSKPIGPVVDLQNPGRPRMSILKDMLGRGEITAQQYENEARSAGKRAGEWETARAVAARGGAQS
jgi:hypothetical protein